MFSKVFTEDIERIVSASGIPWHDVRDSVILITGATGLIGSTLLHVFSAAENRYGLNMQIYAHGRNEEKVRVLAQECTAEFVSGDIRKPLSSDISVEKVDYIFHCAAITDSANMVAKPVDVITTSVDGTRSVLEFAVKKKSKSVVYLSSMEVYGQLNSEEVKEDDIGFLDISKPRSSYPESKRLCECMCIAYLEQYGVPVRIARLARTFGAGTPNNEFDTRVAMQFARKAIAGEDIELHTQGNSLNNCCYTSDSVSGLLTVLLKGDKGEAYNIVNQAATVTIREMAEVVAKDVCDGRISVVTTVPSDIAKRGYAPDVGFRLSADKLENLGWKPKYNLADMYKRMIADWLEETE